ncbi:MAG: flagellar biosynthetic protein FliO [Actinomycetales bacterium]|nr:flagellar biosynthetic protein FliO [Actinomycetales bacterium]
MSPAEQLELTARAVLSLVVVLALVVLVARLVRRSGLRGPGVGLRVLDRVGLAREASLAVVEVGDRALLLGVTSHTVSLLTELDPAVLDPTVLDPAVLDPAVLDPAVLDPAVLDPAVLDPATPGSAALDPASGATAAGVPGASGAAAGTGPTGAPRFPLRTDRGTARPGAAAGAGRERVPARRAPAGGRSRWHGSVLAPSTWRQAIETLRDLTARGR